jgi:hypothetical protein
MFWNYIPRALGKYGPSEDGSEESISYTGIGSPYEGVWFTILFRFGKLLLSIY